MDPAQGETGGKSLTSKLKAKVPHTRVKDKVKNLKNLIPGMKKHAGGDDEGHEDSSEYDNDSPRSPGPETGYNVSDSTPFSTVKTTPPSQDSYSPPSNERTSSREVQNRDYDSRPSQINPSGYDAQNRNYVATAAPTRSAPMPADSPRSNLAPSMEEKFKYLDVGEKAPSAVNPQTDRSYQPEQQYSPSVTNRQTDPVRSYQPEQQYSPSVTNRQTDPVRSYQPEQQYSPSVTNPQTDPIHSYQPEQQYSPSVTNPQTDPIRSHQPEQQYSPSTTESIQKGYSDGPRSSYRASPTAPANKGMVDKVKASVAGAAVVLGDRMGYYNDNPPAARDPNAPSILDKAKSTLGLDKPRDPNAPSIVDKTKATLGLDKPRDPNAPSIVDKTKATLGLDKPRDPNAPSIVDKTKATLGLDKPGDPNAPSVVDKSKATLGLNTPRDPNAPSIVDKSKATLGLDKPRDPNAPPLTEKAKAYMNVASQKTREYGATAADHAAWTKDRVAAHTTPTHHDKALSEQVTQTLSALPSTIREKVFGPTSPSASTANSPKTPGIADRVSGAVSSLFSSAPKPTGERLQQTFPAQSDFHGNRAAASAPQNFADRSSAAERMPATPTPAYPPSYPTVNN